MKWVGKNKNFTEVWQVSVRSLYVEMASPDSGQSWRNGALNQAPATLRYLWSLIKKNTPNLPFTNCLLSL